MDIEKSLLIGDMLEKISEADIHLEEIESEYPSIIKEFDLPITGECPSPMSLSINQLKRINSLRKPVDPEELETSKTIQLLSDFIELNP